MLTILLNSEMEVMRSHFGLDVKAIESVEGYDLTKGKRQKLYIARVCQSGSISVDGTTAISNSDGTALKQSLVK